MSPRMNPRFSAAVERIAGSASKAAVRPPAVAAGFLSVALAAACPSGGCRPPDRVEGEPAALSVEVPGDGSAA